jgi:nucleoside-diphosphate-sugar epimerase
MKIIITGSLGHISKPLRQELVAKGHNLRIKQENHIGKPY